MEHMKDPTTMLQDPTTTANLALTMFTDQDRITIRKDHITIRKDRITIRKDRITIRMEFHIWKDRITIWKNRISITIRMEFHIRRITKIYKDRMDILALMLIAHLTTNQARMDITQDGMEESALLIKRMMGAVRLRRFSITSQPGS
jgi:hypothetical protein